MLRRPTPRTHCLAIGTYSIWSLALKSRVRSTVFAANISMQVLHFSPSRAGPFSFITAQAVWRYHDRTCRLDHHVVQHRGHCVSSTGMHEQWFPKEEETDTKRSCCSTAKKLKNLVRYRASWSSHSPSSPSRPADSSHFYKVDRDRLG